MNHQVQLIAYVDRLGGGGITELQALLAGPLNGVFGAVHLLPFYDPIDGADAGFDPIDHTRVDPRLGSWEDIKTLSAYLAVMADVIVNHMSDRSAQFNDYLQHGSASRFNGLFLTRESLFPEGASSAEVAAIHRPRPGAPFRDMRLDNGERVTLWTTFTPHQIDIDVRHPLGEQYLRRVLATLAVNGVSMVRFDAIGYAIKKPGTSCFMIDETFDFIGKLTAVSRSFGIEVLVEVHAHYQRQIEIASHVDWVYDFALPPLVLHALSFGTAQYLKHWITIRPRNAITVLDTHDGIGIVDIGADKGGVLHGAAGLVPPDQIDALVERIHVASGGESLLATGAAASNLDLYQVNCTFFDALGRDERRYWLARAIQFFLPGIPQVYYVGLLAGHNDLNLLERTGVGRDINRHYYPRKEILAQLERPIVKDLIALIRLRNEHPAFGGEFKLCDSGPETLLMSWTEGERWTQLEVNLASAEFNLTASAETGVERPAFGSSSSPAGSSA
jgi:sucrose phosphorylase